MLNEFNELSLARGSSLLGCFAATKKLALAQISYNIENVKNNCHSPKYELSQLFDDRNAFQTCTSNFQLDSVTVLQETDSTVKTCIVQLITEISVIVTISLLKDDVGFW